MAIRGIANGIHYLDDFLFGGCADSSDCREALSTVLATCTEMGFPVAQDKVEGPSTAITFLDIYIDTTAGELRLPQEKLDRILHELTQWSLKRSCRKRELLSLIGVLHHASTVVPPGRLFLRRLFLRCMIFSHLFLRPSQTQPQSQRQPSGWQ